VPRLLRVVTLVPNGAATSPTRTASSPPSPPAPPPSPLWRASPAPSPPFWVAASHTCRRLPPLAPSPPFQVAGGPEVCPAASQQGTPHRQPSKSRSSARITPSLTTVTGGILEALPADANTDVAACSLLVAEGERPASHTTTSWGARRRSERSTRPWSNR
jgi:hypothetical protein